MGRTASIQAAATVPAKNPKEAFFNSPASTRLYEKFDEVARLYIEAKHKDIRPTTFRSYSSFTNIIRNWVNSKYPELKMACFNRQIAIEFLEDMEKKNLGARTYNNMIRLGSALFGWAIKKGYTVTNPFENQDRKRETTKKRTIIKQEDQILIDKWFAENRPVMRIVCRMVYTSLLRPVEITRVQVNQLDFVNHCIYMPGEKTKNWETREGRMDEELEEMLREHTRYAKPDDYVFSSDKMDCGPSQLSDKSFRKCWDKMRRALRLPDEYQLYSLKDTAINSMLKAGVDDLSVMQAAGHKDLKMTVIYANHHDAALIDNLNKKAPKFAH